MHSLFVNKKEEPDRVISDIKEEFPVRDERPIIISFNVCGLGYLGFIFTLHIGSVLLRSVGESLNSQQKSFARKKVLRS